MMSPLRPDFTRFSESLVSIRRILRIEGQYSKTPQGGFFMDWKKRWTRTLAAGAAAFSLAAAPALAAPEEGAAATAADAAAAAEATAATGEGTAPETAPVALSESPAEGMPAPAVPAGANADAASPTSVAPTANEAEAQALSPEEVLELYQDHGVKHTSQRYGYSIICPKKPNVIPASLLVEGARGDVLIFENDGYDIKNAWVVLAEAFDDEELPPDMGQKPEADQQAYIDHLMNTAGYEFVRLTQVAGSTGVYAVTAKVIDVDTNGDGQPDETMVADNQGIKTFFRGQFGGKFSVQLIDNPELSPAGVSLYQLGLLTFQEWPSAVQDGQNIAKGQDKKTAEDKKEEKVKQDKKEDKKDKKENKKEDTGKQDKK